MNKYKNRKVNENVLIRREVTLRKKINDVNISNKQFHRIMEELREIKQILNSK
jgi:hypothetical protein